MSHTADLIKSEILEVIEKIGSEKFAAIISDNASAVAAARQRISDTYPHIMNIHCILLRELITSYFGERTNSLFIIKLL